MTASKRRQQGFTLVEILIVVVILGILAAIVIPQFTSASESARASSLVSQLQTIRSQLELYQVQHVGAYPTLAQLQDEWEVMTSKTLADGTVDADGDFGPYLQKPPVNPFESSSSVADAAAATVGWVYDEDTGSITACISGDKNDEVGLAENDVTEYGGGGGDPAP